VHRQRAYVGGGLDAPGRCRRRRPPCRRASPAPLYCTDNDWLSFGWWVRGLMSCRRRKAPTRSNRCGGCRWEPVLARGPSWSPVPRLRLRSRAARLAGQRTLFGRDPRGLRQRWFYSKLNINKTKQNRSVNIFSWKIYFTNKGGIRILRVSVIASLQIIYHTTHRYR
jgi:hypothetical protein